MLLLSSSSSCFSFDGPYLYPCLWIGKPDAPMVYLVHQKIDKRLEVWVWDVHNNNFFKGLPSHLNPTLLTLVPNQEGISFLDQGRIRVKFFDKRSVMSIDIDSPIYDILSFSWIDRNSLYVCAKQYGHYAIFHLTITGELEAVVQDEHYDLIYPQKITDSLYYIKHNNNESGCVLMHSTYPSIPLSEENNFNALDTFDERVARLLGKKNESRAQGTLQQQSLLLGFDEIHSPVSLSMTSENSGFVINYDATACMFDAYYIEKRAEVWRYEKAFSFKIPYCFVAGDTTERLTESLAPLLPRYHEGKIYFVDYDENLFVILSYNVKTYEIKKEYVGKKHSFSPLFIGDLLLCSSSLF